MHPILASRDRILLYSASWVAISGLLVFLMAASGDLPWVEAATIVLPLCLLYGSACLSAWYVCRAMPPRRGIPRLLLTNFAAAWVLSSLWATLARLIAHAFPGGEARLAHGIPLLLGIGVLLYMLSAAFHYMLMMFDDARRAEAREVQASLLAREAELKALKAQVNPHFLFNCLNSISALTSSDPRRAREMCVLLGEFLRSTLGLGEKPAIALDDELALARSYLAVERVRFGERLRFEESVEEGCGTVQVPPLLLQPLIENAVTHGIASMVDGGLVRLAVRAAGRGVTVVVENDFDPEAPARRRNGVGLANVRKRLDVRYGGEAKFETRADGGVYRAVLSLPARET